jgi:Protein of unknown function (DUF3306)
VSEPEGFLARWTRLKREAEEAARAPSTHEPSHPDKDASSEPAPTVEGSQPAVDLSTLPPLDAITATTDIRAFLAPGVPAELTRAALRRAWLADPTIRDFVGIAENQWDFNDPHGIPGFGPLEDADRLVAQLLGGEQRDDAPPADAPNLETALDAVSRPGAAATRDEIAPAVDDQLDPTAYAETSMSAEEPVVAPPQGDRRQPERLAIPRAHGGALPK